MKKYLALVLALAMVFALCACGSAAAPAATAAPAAAEAAPAAAEAAPAAEAEAAPAAQTVKFGLITLHDENSTYDKNFIDGLNEAVANLAAEGIEVVPVVKTGIPEDQTCYDTACDLADDGCNLIFADSFSHESFLIEAAKEYTDVEFLHATGYQAAIVNMANFHDAFAAIYEGRYLAGVAAGLKLQEMIDAGTVDAENVKVGYVGAYTYAEVISGYTSWFLGVQSIVPNATMEVTFTGSWYDETAEKEAANALLEDGCVLISQHADSMGAPTACEEANVPDVTYNVSTESACPNTYLAGSKINWAPYIEYAVKCYLNGEAIATDYVGDFTTGSVEVLAIGASAAEGTEAKLAEVRAAIESGELKVYDCSKFTVDGKNLTAEDDEHVVDGVYMESGAVSAPSFAYMIDGVSFLGEAVY